MHRFVLCSSAYICRHCNYFIGCSLRYTRTVATSLLQVERYTSYMKKFSLYNKIFISYSLQLLQLLARLCEASIIVVMYGRFDTSFDMGGPPASADSVEIITERAGVSELPSILSQTSITELDHDFIFQCIIVDTLKY